MKKMLNVGSAVTALALAASAGFAGPFTAGNLVVVQIGDGTTVLGTGGAPLFLVEINPSSGAVVQTIPLPTTTAGSTHSCVVRGTSTSVGHVNRSVDGRFLALIGVDAAVGAAVSTSTAATNPRVVARIDAAGAIDTSTALTDAYDSTGAAGANADGRAAVTTNGTDFWLSGVNGGATAAVFASAGIRYTTLGATTSVQLTDPPTNTRVVGIWQGNLYFTSASGTNQGVSQVGTGLPTSGIQTAAVLPGFPTSQGPDMYDFFFADANTIYVADNGNGVGEPVTDKGAQKWTFDGTSWTKQYVLATGLTTGLRGLIGSVNAGTVTLFCTEGNAGTTTIANHVVTVVDTGAASTFTALGGAAPAQATYRGIAFAPVAAPATCYPNCNDSTQCPVVNTGDFTCFLQQYSAAVTLPAAQQQTHYANCDGSTTFPQVNTGDFTCFLQKYAASCSGC